MSGIEIIEIIKASGAENCYFERWAGFQASVNSSSVRFALLNQYLGAVPGALQQIANLAVLVLGVMLIMNGKFTVGMLLAFQGFMSLIFRACDAFISRGQEQARIVDSSHGERQKLCRFLPWNEGKSGRDT